MTTELKVAFIGGGNMASALIGGMIGKVTTGGNILVIERNAEAAQKLEEKFGVRTTCAIDASLKTVDVIVLAVKPQQLREVAQAAGAWLDRQLIISIAAGIRMTDIARWLGGYQKIVRCMPNTPSLINLGITGMVGTSQVDTAARNAADAILAAVGGTVWLPREEDIDAVTGVSGSGPAYVFYFMEAMQAAAEQLGLSPEQGLKLTIDTFIGASMLAAQSTEPLATLREKVTSKGGTTFAALESMRAAHVDDAIKQAVYAAAKRGKEMGDELGQDVL